MALVVECCFFHGHPGLNFTRKCTNHYQATKITYSTFSRCFWFIIFCTEDGCHDILFTLLFSPFISTPRSLPTLISVSVMPCITISSSTGSTSSSAHFTLWVNWLPMLMLIKFNRIIILWSKNKSIGSVFHYINGVICYTYIFKDL